MDWTSKHNQFKPSTDRQIHPDYHKHLRKYDLLAQAVGPKLNIQSKIADPNISGHLTVWQLLKPLKLSLVTSLLSLKIWDDINWLQLLLLVNRTKKIPEIPKPVKSTRAVTPASSSNPYLNRLLMSKYEYQCPGHTGTTG